MFDQYFVQNRDTIGKGVGETKFNNVKRDYVNRLTEFCQQNPDAKPEEIDAKLKELRDTALSG